MSRPELKQAGCGWEAQGSWAGQLQLVQNTDFTTHLPAEGGFLQEPTLKQRANILTLALAHGQSAPRSYLVFFPLWLRVILLQEKRADRIRSMQRYGPFWVAKDLKGHWKHMKNEPKGDLCQSQIVLHSMVLQFLGRWCTTILHQ